MTLPPHLRLAQIPLAFAPGHPGGMNENSPMLQRWVLDKKAISPKGTAETSLYIAAFAVDSSVPSGLGSQVPRAPIENGLALAEGNDHDFGMDKAMATHTGANRERRKGQCFKSLRPTM
jgi:hypothetical protein